MSNLFTPLTLGSMQLTHRVVLAPLTRSRSPTELANDNNVLYYHQRASKGGLLITEGTWCSKTARGYDYVPGNMKTILNDENKGILTPEHGEAWKKVTKAVHSKGGYIFAQLWFQYDIS